MSAFPGTSGPLDTRVAFVGVAWGAEEAEGEKPLVGSSGEEFNRMLASTGLLSPQRDKEGHGAWMQRAFREREETYFLTNLLHRRGPIERLCGGKTQVTSEYRQELPRLRQEWPDFNWPAAYSWEAVMSGKYLLPRYLDALPRLQRELDATSANVIVPLGGEALWALAGSGGIMASRGTALAGRLVRRKILPTFNPAYILRTWEDRPIMLADLQKVRGEMDFPELRLPERTIWLAPSISDLHDFDKRHLTHTDLLSFDIETTREQVEMVGFASDSGHAIPVPFVDFLKRNYNYWAKEKDEKEAWLWCWHVLTRDVPKLAQNSLFDVQYLWEKIGIPPVNCLHDTMYQHHALQPEMKKSLAFLASLYTTEASWKSMRGSKDPKDDD